MGSTATNGSSALASSKCSPVGHPTRVALLTCSHLDVLSPAASKFFHHLATPVLYSSPIIRGPTALKSLVTTLGSASRPLRPFSDLHAPKASYIHSLSLQDLSTPDWLIAQELGHFLVSSAPSASSPMEARRGRPLYRRRPSRERTQVSHLRRYPLQTLTVECAGRDLTNAMPFFQQLDVLEAFEWNTAPCWLIRPAELFTALLVSGRDSGSSMIAPGVRMADISPVDFLFAAVMALNAYAVTLGLPVGRDLPHVGPGPWLPAQAAPGRSYDELSAGGDSTRSPARSCRWP